MRWAFIPALMCCAALWAADPAKPAVKSAKKPRTPADRFWEQIADRDPPDMLSLRTLFTQMRGLCERKEHVERLPRFLELAARAQDSDPASKTHGNYKWTWRDKGVTDGNAVEFISQDALPMWIEHRDGMPEPTRRQFRELMLRNIEGCMGHRVPTSYTNIAILNAVNLIVYGEQFERADALQEGLRRLDSFSLWTRSFGTFEFCSPTYYAVDLDGCVFLAKYAKDPSVRRKAETLSRLFWLDLAANWFQPSEKMGGSQSRSYDYLTGVSGTDAWFERAGWLGKSKPTISLPSEIDALHSRFPRRVEQSWGMNYGQSRTNQLYFDVALSTSGTAYGSQDMLLTVDLAGPRCFFIPDGREDPYGKIKYETSSARHMKALHLTPFWAAAQRGPDALALAVYRPADLAIPSATTLEQGAEKVATLQNLQSHFVVRRNPDAVWVGARRVHPARGTPQKPERIPLAAGESLVLQYGSALVGIRAVWSRDQRGTPALSALVDDGQPLAMRFTLEHKSTEKNPSAECPGAAIWVRVGSGLSDERAIDAWRKDFSNAKPSVEIGREAFRLTVPGVEGNVALKCRSPFGPGDLLELTPAPSAAVLAVDGRDLGRALFPPEKTEIVTVSQQGRAEWPADGGAVFAGMAVVEENGHRFVWQPLEDPKKLRRNVNHGFIVWTLRVPKAGRYYLWGKTLATTQETNSFYLTVLSPGAGVQKATWSLPVGPDWKWNPLQVNADKKPTPLDLPAGVCRIQLLPRETGTKIERLFLTADPKERPK